MMADERLDRLLDYTKFHIGIYLSFGGGLVALIGTGETGQIEMLAALISCPTALLFSLVFMTLAGLSGGIIASGCTQYQSFNELWNEPQGPAGWKLLNGKYWANIEHISFWISLVFITYAVIGSKVVKIIFGG